VVGEHEQHGVLAVEVVAEADHLAGLVLERRVGRHLTLQVFVDADVHQLRRDVRRAGVAHVHLRARVRRS
jgi:hypothetical protein